MGEMTSQKDIFNKVSLKSSKLVTNSYSTSFSIGIKMLDKKIQNDIHSIYGFVRLADEIVDTFHDSNKVELLDKLREETIWSIKNKISLNPIINSFQMVYNKYKIDWQLVDQFLKSMKMDLTQTEYTRDGYDEYILGSAQVVGLMCLKVFLSGDQNKYEKLKPYAMSLGSAFQKVNFLRDLKDDYLSLGRTYFPEIDLSDFNDNVKLSIERDIEEDFKKAYRGILELPKGAKMGVYISYVYYTKLFDKIKSKSSSQLLEDRVRLPNIQKYGILVTSIMKSTRS